MKIVKLQTAVKNSDGLYIAGEMAAFNVDDVSGIVPVRNQYHSFRPVQELAEVVLKSGRSFVVNYRVNQAFAKIEEVM